MFHTQIMEAAGMQAARWVLGKALALVSSGALEAWAASTELGPNIEALKMELLYAQGMLNNARGREIQNPALAELLQKLRGLGYRADDVLDELDYFRIQDELDGTYDAADEHEGGCLRNCALNARHTARAISKQLSGFSKCCSRGGGDSRSEPAEEATRGGAWPPCLGLTAPSDDDDEEEEEKEADHGCIGRLASGARNTIHAVGKHLPYHSASSVQSEQQTPKLKFNRVQISQTMKEIIEQLKPVCAKVSKILSLELLNSNRNIAQKTAKSRPITTSEFIETKFVGREGTTSRIILDITSGEYCDKTLTVLPIVGPGGIGKTTLTQYIHNAAEVEKYFEVKLWVCVSVNFSAYRLTKEIEDKLSSKNIEEKLKSKRFLLVLDDMWNYSDEDEWKRFLVPFTKGQAKGSVILVTTRFPAVAQMVKTVDHHIDLEGLDHASFRQLFFACIFEDKKTQDDHSELLETGEIILQKLKGSPLAAKTVGRLLRKNLDLDHWMSVLESREWESQQGDHDIMPALKLSFDYLPFHLQQCFTYCALFPEDYRFGREELIHFWIGLDALHSHSENISMEDIGVRYLNELVNHGFFKMEKEENRGTCYVIHDLLHELALKVSAHECLNIYSSSVSSTQVFPSVRHLSVNIEDSSVKDINTFNDCKKDFSALDKRLKVENLHSLILFGRHQGSFAKTLGGLFGKAKALRVIFLSGTDYSIEDLFPNYLNLVHLRYIQLAGSVLGSGPSNNISRYYHLRILHLRGWYYRYDPPRDMGNLTKLRHFVVDESRTRTRLHSSISKVGKLKSLQALERFMVKKESEGFELKEIGQLLELHGYLNICDLEKVESREEAEEAKLMHKKHLKGVLLHWSIDRSNKDPSCEEEVLEGLKPCINLSHLCISGHGGEKCPSWLGVNLSVKNLESLRLVGVAWKTFPPIGKLLCLVNGEVPSDVSDHNFHNLRKIELVNLECIKKWVVDSTCRFHSCLETLIISDCYELMELSFPNSTCGSQEKNTCFPKLRELRIDHCPKLSSLPSIPWAHHASCEIRIANTGLGFTLESRKTFDNRLSLRIEGEGAHQDDDVFWRVLDFDKLPEVKELELHKCPPLPFDRLKMLSCIKDVYISRCSNIFGPAEEKGSNRVQLHLPIESIHISWLGASGKELTQVLSYMPKLLELIIFDCEKITWLGVLEKATCAMDNNAGAQTTQECWSSGEEEEITAEKGSLLLPPQLQELQIRGCPDLRLGPDVSVGLRGLCSLRSLTIVGSHDLFSSYLSSSSSCWAWASPFPPSLQVLHLTGVELAGKSVSLSNLSSLTNLEIDTCEGFCSNHLPLGGCLTRLILRNTRNFFLLPKHDGLSSSCSPFSVLQSLTTDDAAGVLAAPICSLLSSSLTYLDLNRDNEIQRFTEQQEEALQLLTALQEVRLWECDKLECLPAAGLRRLPNLSTIYVYNCGAIRSLPKGALPDSLQKLQLHECRAIRSLLKDGLPDSLQELMILSCPAIRALPKDGLPNSLQELVINDCPAIRALPKGGLPSSLRLLDVRGNSEELTSQCRKLTGIIPIVQI